MELEHVDLAAPQAGAIYFFLSDPRKKVQQNEEK